MNKIVRPITPDGLCGFDEVNQLVLWEPMSDGSRKGYRVRDVRDKTCRICARGWDLTVASIRDQTYWHSYEEIVHLSCLVRYGALKERDLWSGILGELQIIYRDLKEVPNQYWVNDEWYSKRPWYVADLITIPADLELGHRKRVYSIRIKAVGPDPLNGWEAAKEAFGGEDVTKEFNPRSALVHAWTDGAAKDYVGRLAKALGFDEKASRAHREVCQQSDSKAAGF